MCGSRGVCRPAPPRVLPRISLHTWPNAAIPVRVPVYLDHLVRGRIRGASCASHQLLRMHTSPLVIGRPMISCIPSDLDGHRHRVGRGVVSVRGRTSINSVGTEPSSHASHHRAMLPRTWGQSSEERGGSGSECSCAALCSVSCGEGECARESAARVRRFLRRALLSTGRQRRVPGVSSRGPVPVSGPGGASLRAPLEGHKKLRPEVWGTGACSGPKSVADVRSGPTSARAGRSGCGRRNHGRRTVLEEAIPEQEKPQGSSFRPR